MQGIDTRLTTISQEENPERDEIDCSCYERSTQHQGSTK